MPTDCWEAHFPNTFVQYHNLVLKPLESACECVSVGARFCGTYKWPGCPVERLKGTVVKTFHRWGVCHIAVQMDRFWWKGSSYRPIWAYKFAPKHLESKTKSQSKTKAVGKCFWQPCGGAAKLVQAKFWSRSAGMFSAFWRSHATAPSVLPPGWDSTPRVNASQCPVPGRKNHKRTPWKSKASLLLESLNVRGIDPGALALTIKQRVTKIQKKEKCVGAIFGIQESRLIDSHCFDEDWRSFISVGKRKGNTVSYGVALSVFKVKGRFMEVCPAFVVAFVPEGTSSPVYVNLYWPQSVDDRTPVVKATSDFLQSFGDHRPLVLFGDFNFRNFKSELEDFKSRFQLVDNRNLFPEQKLKRTYYGPRGESGICDLVLVSKRFASIMQKFQVEDVRGLNIGNFDHALLTSRVLCQPKWKTATQTAKKEISIDDMALDVSDRVGIRETLGLHFSVIDPESGIEAGENHSHIVTPEAYGVASSFEESRSAILESGPQSKVEETFQTFMDQVRNEMESSQRSAMSLAYELCQDRILKEQAQMSADPNSLLHRLDSFLERNPPCNLNTIVVGEHRNPLLSDMPAGLHRSNSSVQFPPIPAVFETHKNFDLESSMSRWMDLTWDPSGPRHVSDVVSAFRNKQRKKERKLTKLRNAEQSQSHLPPVGQTDDVPQLAPPDHRRWNCLVKNLHDVLPWLPRKLPYDAMQESKAVYNCNLASNLAQMANLSRVRLSKDEAQSMLDDMSQQRFARIKGFIDDMHKSFRKNPRVAFSLIEKLTSTKGRVRIETPMSECVSHFQKILSPKMADTLDSLPEKKVLSAEILFNLDPPTLKELEEVISHCCPDRACGIDGIPWEIWWEIRSHLLVAFQEIWSSGIVPSEWRCSIVTPVPKKGDLTLIVNNRPVALLPHAAKIFNGIILLRLRKALDFIVGPYQNGFRPNRNTQQHVLTLQQLIQNTEDAKVGTLPLFLLFVDFKNAFSSISWRAMAKTLNYYHVPLQLQSLIMSMYEGHSVNLRVNGELSDSFQLSRGVLQGDTLAPFLFVLTIQRVLDNIEMLEEFGIPAWPTYGDTNSGRTSARPRMGKIIKRIRFLAYADDIVLMADNVKDLEAMFQLLEQHALDIGLEINYGQGKTECMKFGTPHRNYVITSLSGQKIRFVKSYKYLGVTLPDFGEHITNRIRSAWEAAHKLRLIWKSHLDVEYKRKLFQALIESRLLYGLALRPLSKAVLQRIHAAHSDLLQFALNLKLNYRTPLGPHLETGPHLEDLYGSIDPVCVTLLRQRYEMLGHWARGRTSRKLVHPVIPVLLHDPFQGGVKKRTGSSRISWKSDTEAAFGIPFEEILVLAEDRGAFHIRLRNACIRLKKQFFTEVFTARGKRDGVPTEHLPSYVDYHLHRLRHA